MTRQEFNAWEKRCDKMKMYLARIPGCASADGPENKLYNALSNFMNDMPAKYGIYSEEIKP